MATQKSKRKWRPLTPEERRERWSARDERAVIRALSPTRFMWPKDVRKQIDRPIPLADVIAALKRLTTKEQVLHVPGFGWRRTAAGNARVEKSKTGRKPAAAG